MLPLPLGVSGKDVAELGFAKPGQDPSSQSGILKCHWGGQ